MLSRSDKKNGGFRTDSYSKGLARVEEFVCSAEMIARLWAVAVTVCVSPQVKNDNAGLS